MKKFLFLFLCLILSFSAFAEYNTIRKGSTEDGYATIIGKIDDDFVVGVVLNSSNEYFYWIFDGNSLNKAMEHFSWLSEHYAKSYSNFWRKYGEATLDEESGDITYWIYPTGSIYNYR